MKTKKSNKGTSAQPITMDYERNIPFLKEKHYQFTKADEVGDYYGKVVQASAQMQTPMGTFNVLIGETALIVRHNRTDDTYQLGIIHNGQKELSPSFMEGEFQDLLEKFEEKLMAAK